MLTPAHLVPVRCMLQNGDLQLAIIEKSMTTLLRNDTSYGQVHVNGQALWHKQAQCM